MLSCQMYMYESISGCRFELVNQYRQFLGKWNTEILSENITKEANLLNDKRITFGCHQCCA